MDAKTVLTELIEELHALNEQMMAPYKNNDNVDFIKGKHNMANCRIGYNKIDENGSHDGIDNFSARIFKSFFFPNDGCSFDNPCRDDNRKE